MNVELSDTNSITAMIEYLINHAGSIDRRTRTQHIRTVLWAVLELPGDPPPSRLPSLAGPSRDLLDVEGWLVWADAGLTLFSRSTTEEVGGVSLDCERPLAPSLHAALEQARRTVLALAMVRSKGNLTHAAKTLGTSRRTLREHLKAEGLYPWPRIVGQGA